MSVRGEIKSLIFHDGKDEWEGLFGEQLVQWSAKFRLELHGDETTYSGITTAACDSVGATLAWDSVPPRDKQFLGNLERFVGTAFSGSVHVGIVVQPVNMDEVESDYRAEDDEEDGDAV
jgi:hypothetical protein